MSKEAGGFLRKVVRFVANPTTDWNALDNPGSDGAESEYAKTEIKAMIERKRRNDFVRKRELDMLRKIRREGLSQDHALAMGASSNLDPDSRPQTGTRSDITVKAKIDEIELQMVGSNRPQGTAPSPAQPNHAANAYRPTAPLADIGTTLPSPFSGAPTQALSFDLDDEPPPMISQAVLDSARASASRAAAAVAAPLSAPMAPSGFQNPLDVKVTEVTHDPELDEAVIAFANADFDQCERCLLDLVQPGAVRHHDAETWLTLFDFYRTVDLPQKFEQLAVSYAQHFGLSAPQWFSYPQKVAHFLASGHAPGTDAHPPLSIDAGPDTEAGPDAPPVAQRALEGWVAPARIDQDVAAQLRVEVLQMPRPWVMDWRHVQRLSPEAAHQLGLLMRQWAQERVELIWVGTQPLLSLLADLTPTGMRDTDPAYWMLRLDVLRLCNLPVQFDEVAIDYCVTYELSPPSWEPALCSVKLSQDAISPHTRPLSRVSEVTTSFVESQLQNDVEFVQVAALHLSGQLAGDIGKTLTQLDTQLGASVALEIDCEHLLRVDFIAAGDLLNWVLARRAEDRQVIFLNPHRLVALFFGAMGINEHASVKLRTH
ncbi:STAS domain-containing protein [Aquabacterium sp.]|uniref:STAS domain-containing protein n=1 Tax=Aquabacterium sp. TaxID=1872578 RepID=UPI0025B81783|nr:STAS domain-containing protein [Aquabacterium sp.]